MLSRPEAACLVIADISGYTSYIAGVELDHAQDILADLMDTVVRLLRPSYRLAKLEGDAAFAYSKTESVDASLLMDTLETTYFAFQRRLRDIRQATTCECDACLRIPNLDLKFVAHHGPVAMQRTAGRDELMGRDVILVHRLLKNDVPERTGITAYTLYTEAILTAAGIDDPAALGLVAHVETYEHVGEVRAWLRDLHVAWADEQARTVVEVTPDAAMATIVADFPAPPALVWQFATSPALRVDWQVGVDAVKESTPTGRRGVGTTNHCMHGADAIIEEVLDWRPPDYQTVRITLPTPGAPKMLMTDRFEATPGGTRLTTYLARPRSAKERAALERIVPGLQPVFDGGHVRLRALLEEEMTRLSAEASSEDGVDSALVGSSRG
jgi:hypothetical protein